MEKSSNVQIYSCAAVDGLSVLCWLISMISSWRSLEHFTAYINCETHSTDCCSLFSQNSSRESHSLASRGTRNRSFDVSKAASPPKPHVARGVLPLACFAASGLKPTGGLSPVSTLFCLHHPALLLQQKTPPGEKLVIVKQYKIHFLAHLLRAKRS